MSRAVWPFLLGAVFDNLAVNTPVYALTRGSLIYGRRIALSRSID